MLTCNATSLISDDALADCVTLNCNKWPYFSPNVRIAVPQLQRNEATSNGSSSAPSYCCPHSRRSCGGGPLPPEPKCRIRNGELMAG